MLAIFKRMLGDKFKSLLIFSGSAIAFLEMYIVLFPSIKDQAGSIDKMLKSFPPEMFKALNMDPATLSFSNFEAYLSSEYMSFLWPIMAIIFAISLASYLCVNDVEKGTIELVVALPISRTRIFIERYFAGLLFLLLFCIVSMAGAIPLAMLHGIDFVSNNYIIATIGSMLFICAIYSLAVFCSVLFSEKSKASMLSGGFVVFMYVVYILSTLNKDIENIKYFSFFNYFSGSDLMAKGVYSDYSFLVLGGFIVLVFTAALLRFKTRDLSV